MQSMTHAHIREEILAFLPNKQAFHVALQLYSYLYLPVSLRLLINLHAFDSGH